MIHRKFGHGARLVSVQNVNVADDYVDAGDNDKKKKGFKEERAVGVQNARCPSAGARKR